MNKTLIKRLMYLYCMTRYEAKKATMEAIESYATLNRSQKRIIVEEIFQMDWNDRYMFEK